MQYGNIIFGAAVQSLTGTIQEVILDRFCHSNPVPTKNVTFPPCWKIIKIISLLPCTVRHTVGAAVPGREIQVIYALEFLFPVRNVNRIWLRVWGPNIIFLLNNRNFGFWNYDLFDRSDVSIWGPIMLREIMIYLIDHMYEYGDQLWWGTFF